MPHGERHRSERIGWLRAAVLGANDDIVSTASLVVGVAAAESARHDVLIAGVAGRVAGELAARPLQAALASAVTFAVGAAVPILAILMAPVSAVATTVAVACLVALGATAAFVGGAPLVVGTARVTWSTMEMR